MGHKRVKMELIKNDRSRGQTYKKRKANLLKKIKEFTILCDVKACLIIFGPDDELETWAPESSTVQELIALYRSSDQPKRHYTVSDYFAEKKKRVEGELAKIRKDAYKRRFSNSEQGWIEGLSAEQLGLVLESLDLKLKAADERIAVLDSERSMQGQLVLRHNQEQQSMMMNVNPMMNQDFQDLGFAFEADYDNGYSPKMQNFHQYDSLGSGSSSSELNPAVGRGNGYCHENLNIYPGNPSFLFPDGRGNGNLLNAEGPLYNFTQGGGDLMSQFVRDFGSPERGGIDFGLMQQPPPPHLPANYHVHNNNNYQGMLQNHGNPLIFDPNLLGNNVADVGGMDFISSYQQFQFSSSIGRFTNTFGGGGGGGSEFDGREHKPM